MLLGLCGPGNRVFTGFTGFSDFPDAHLTCV
jgi:hypothetical protein